MADEMERLEPRRRRRGPVAIVLLVALAIGGWSAWWWYAKGQVEQALTAAQPAGPRGAMGWASASVDGWPFRLRVTLRDARATLPDGVGFGASRVVAQAYAYQPSRWVATAPEGFTILRPVAGPVDVRGRVLRASAVNLAGPQPRFAFEGRELTLSPRAGADPFLLDRIASLDAEFVEGPPGIDEAALLVRMSGGRARPTGLLSYIGQGGEASLHWEVLITRYRQLTGATGEAAARRWARQGGVARFRDVRLRAGGSAITNRGGELSLGPDGRLRGVLQLELSGGPLGLAALALAAPGGEAALGAAAAQASDPRGSRLRLAFEGGSTTVGGVPVGPAPALF